MKAKFINEVNNFERGQDPKTAMDVGMTPERRLNTLKKELKNFGISIAWHPDADMGKGFYFVIIEDDIHVFNDEDLSDMNLQIGYSTDKAAMAEFDMTGGFWMADEWSSDITDPEEVSHDINGFIKQILLLKYRNEINVKNELKKIKSNMDILTKVKIFLEK